MNEKIQRRSSPRRFVVPGSALLAIACIVAAQPLAGQDRPPSGAAGSNIIEDLVLANRILANEGIVDGLGHVSVRHDQRPDRFLLSRAMAPAVVTAEDVMEYDLDGNPVDARGRSMYGERFIHAAIYKARPDVKAVVHCHTPSVLPFANTGVPMRPMYQMSSFLAAGAPVFEIRNVEGAIGMLVTNTKLGAALAATLGSSTAVLMRGHGAVIVGRSIPEAVSNSIHLDINAKMQAQAMALGGKVRYLSPEEAAAANPYDRFWDHWKLRIVSK